MIRIVLGSLRIGSMRRKTQSTIGRVVALGRPLALSGAILAAFILSFQPASSQGEVVTFSITGIEAEDFPTVRLQVLARDGAGAPVPLQKESLRLTESGVEQPISFIEERQVGVRVAFVIDIGDGKLNTGESLASVYGIAKPSIEDFVSEDRWMAGGVDQAIVLVTLGEETQILVPMTTNPEEILSQLAAYVTPSDESFSEVPDYGDYTRGALMDALEELEFTRSGDDKQNALVLFSPGIRASLDDVFERAVGAHIPIHIILARTSPTAYWAEALIPLAQRSGGQFIPYYESRTLGPLFEEIVAQRVQQVVTYRSDSPAKGDRPVTLDLNTGSQFLTASAQYQVDLQPPQADMISPSADSKITRTGQGDLPASEAQPTFLNAAARIDWPDGLPRELKEARLLVDDIAVAQGQLSPDRADFTWDIRNYQDAAAKAAVLRVEVVDELGLRGVSPPLPISIEYVAAPVDSKSNETALERVVGFAPLGVAALALVLAVVAVFNRGRLAPVIQQAGEGIADFVERVTGRRTALVAKAYLVPLEGFDQSPAKSFEIYGTTAIGRSRRHADLLFHIKEEDSPISRLHCTILDEDDHFAIRDEDSSNGTHVNGVKLTPLEPRRLHDGDLIDVAPLERGGLRFLFQLAAADGDRAPDDELRRTQPRRSAG